MEYLSEQNIEEPIFENGRFEEHYTDAIFVKETARNFSGGTVHVRENNVMVEKVQKARKEVLSVVYEAKRRNDLQNVFIVEYRRKLNREHHPKFNERNEEMTHIEFAWKLKRHLAHQLNTFPGNKHTVFWIEYEDSNKTDDNVSTEYEYPEFIIYFERQFLGESLQYRLDQCNTTYESKMKWLFEIFEASCEIFWHILYVQLLTEKHLLIQNNSCYIDMDPLFNSKFKWSFEDNWLLKVYPTSSIKPVDLRCPSDNVYVWRELLTDTIFQIFNMHLDDTPEELKSGLVWWRLNNNYYSLKDISLYVEVEAFVLLTRIYKSRTLEDLIFIKETSKNRENKLECFDILLSKRMEGGFGDVYFVFHKLTKQKHALKILSVENLVSKGLSFEQIKQNVRETSSLDHPNVIKYTDIWFANDDRGLLTSKHKLNISETDFSYVTSSGGAIDGSTKLEYSTCTANTSSGGEYVTVVANLESTSAYQGVPRFLFILMEACDCSLMDKIADSRTDQGVLFKYMKELLEGVIYIHQEQFMHGDLKPLNALITHDGRLVVADLDTMLTIPEKGKTVTMKQFRTKHYAPPEMSTNIWDERVDYYAIGITFCQMLMHGMHPKEIEQILKSGQLGNQGFHKQIVFLLRWLTQSHIQHRAGIHDIHIIRSLLDVQSVEEFYVTERSFYSTDLKGNATSKQARAIKVALKLLIIKHLLHKYHAKYDTVRIIEKAEMDRLHSLNRNINIEWMLDLVDGKVTVVPQGDVYVYILYYGEKYSKEAILCEDEHISVLLTNLDNAIDPFVGEAAGKAFTKSGLTSEPDVLRAVPEELLDSELTLFWSPARMSGAEPKQESDSFACGLLCLRQFCLGTREEDLSAATRQLQKGETPVLLETLSRSQIFVINTLCAFDPGHRTRVKNLRPTVARVEEEIIDSDNLYSQNLIKNECVYAMILSVADDKTTQELFAAKFSIYSSVKFLPENLINDWKPLISETKNMLKSDGAGDNFVEVPRDDDAVNVVVQLPGVPFEQLWQKKFALCERLSHIQEFFLFVHIPIRNRIHGSIMLKNARYHKTGGYIVPALTTTEYNNFLESQYCAPEQKIGATGSLASDVFSLGVLLYELLCMAFFLEPKLKHEFKTTNDFELAEDFPQTYKSLIKAMTYPEPNQRPNINEVYTKLREECGIIMGGLKANTKLTEYSTEHRELPSFPHRKSKYGGFAAVETERR